MLRATHYGRLPGHNADVASRNAAYADRYASQPLMLAAMTCAESGAQGMTGRHTVVARSPPNKPPVPAGRNAAAARNALARSADILRRCCGPAQLMRAVRRHGQDVSHVGSPTFARHAQAVPFQTEHCPPPASRADGVTRGSAFGGVGRVAGLGPGACGVDVRLGAVVLDRRRGSPFPTNHHYSPAPGPSPLPPAAAPARTVALLLGD